MQASFQEAHKLLDSHTTLSTRLSFVTNCVLVPGCAAFGPITLVAIEKVLVFVVTVAGGTPVIETSVSVVVVLEGLGTQEPVQLVTM